MKIIFSDLTDFNYSLPEGVMNKNGQLIPEKLRVKFEKQFNNYAHGSRLSVQGWYEKPTDYNCMSHVRDPLSKKYNLLKINPNWIEAINMYLYELSQYKGREKPICVISFFMKYTYQPTWFENLQGIKGWWAKDAWQYVKEYIDVVMSEALIYEDKIDFYYEICNEPTAEMLPMITKIFNHFRTDKGLSLREIVPGYQKLKKGSGTSFTKPGTWKDFKNQYTEPFAARIDRECPGVVHQFFKLECPKRLADKSNLHHHEKIYYWSTDGDKKLKGGVGSERRPGQKYFNKIIPLLRGKDIYNCYFKHSFFECFTYKNDDACLYLAKAHYTAFGVWPDKLKKQSDGIPEIPEIPEVPKIPEPETEVKMIKDWTDFKGFWKYIKKGGFNALAQLAIHMVLGWIIIALIIWVL